MSREDEDIDDVVAEDTGDGSTSSGQFDKVISDGTKKYKLSGMYREWFLDYASYVILERAVPHIEDGLKPVQRRILHAMKQEDDGRFNKVASLVGATMPYHPHGDASIKDALVQLGQKDLLIDCQGNWGNILTGDPAAAGRYIEARLTPFANEVLYNPKLTEWVNSYDGRNQEPVNLPVKFPLLLAQGSEGIAVGLACKILPHNFNELIDASIAVLKGEEFNLEPDFPTGGFADTSAYNRGLRGGRIRVRANIQKINKNTLAITEIPYGTTTGELMESIIKANDKGKIKIRKIDDNTAENAEIIIQLYSDTSPDKTIDALYAFTDCEVSISPNTCVIKDKRPQFMGVDDILRDNTERTRELMRRELTIRLGEVETEWHYTSLEKIFFENRVYKILENDARSWEHQLEDVKTAMQAYRHLLRRDISDEDIQRLVEKPVRKISKFDIKAVNEKIRSIEEKEAAIRNSLEHLTQYCIDYFTALKAKYGAKHPRRTKIISFEDIEAVKVVANNAKLYLNRSEGFIGTSAKKIEDAEYVCDCSDIDEVIVFLKDGRYTLRKISDKQFVEKGIMHAAVFKRGDTRTVYNAIYRDGKDGYMLAKRFSVPSIIRDRWYDLTKGTPGSQVFWFSANPNGEAETVKIYLRNRQKLKKLILEFDFASLAIKGRGSMGNLVTKHPVQKILLKSAGISTIGGKQMWFDHDIDRLNEDGRGRLLGEFRGDEHILAVCKDGSFYTTGLDLSTRFQGDLLIVEKFDPDKVFTAIYWDKASGYYYIKRFCFEISDNTAQNFIPADEGARLIAVSEDRWPSVNVEFIPSGNKPKEPAVIDADEFIGVKSFRAKGKRAGEKISSIAFGEPLVKDYGEDEEEPVYSLDVPDAPEEGTVTDSSDSDSPASVSGEDGHKAGDIVELNIDIPQSYSNGDDSDEPTLF
ncbi:MAG TPA: DNA gyrase/topoisomerase IV subunit A [Candidatus Coprenecus pullistercoris]|nr:DNA gyrase/topoisomerase IV subunit A [Candidatus Coprenecus pullistercoris]